MKNLLTTLAIITLVHSTHAQYNCTSNAKCIAALKVKSQKGDPSLNTAISFLESAKAGGYKQWQSMLSKECQIQDPQGIKTQKWWNYLSDNKYRFEIMAEKSAQTMDNKIVYFRTYYGNENENENVMSLILIKENNSWKVQSVEL
jgi:hypothetical protein